MLANKVKKRQPSKYIEVLQFDVNDYVQNPIMIKKLNEEKEIALIEINGLNNQLEIFRSNNHDLEIKKRELEVKLNEANHKLAEVNYRSFLQFVVSLLGTLLIGFGINIITSDPNWTGWIMIAFGSTLEVVAFFLAISPNIRKIK